MTEKAEIVLVSPAGRDLGPVVSELRDRAFEDAAWKVIAARRSKNTRRAYLADLERWLIFAYAAGAPPALPSPELVAQVRNACLAVVSGPSCRRTFAALSSIFRRLVSRGQVGFNCFHPDVVEWPEGEAAGKTPALPEADAAAILTASASSPRDCALLTVLHETGFRRMSVVSIERKTMREENGLIVVRALVKGGKVVDVVLPTRSSAMVRGWLEVAPESSWLFCGQRNPSKALGETRVNEILAKYARLTDVSFASPHMLRSAFITTAISAGVNIRDIQAAVHHSDIRTTIGYDRGARGRSVGLDVAKAREKKL